MCKYSIEVYNLPLSKPKLKAESEISILQGNMFPFNFICVHFKKENTSGDLLCRNKNRNILRTYGFLTCDECLKGSIYINDWYVGEKYLLFTYETEQVYLQKVLHV